MQPCGNLHETVRERSAELLLVGNGNANEEESVPKAVIFSSVSAVVLLYSYVCRHYRGSIRSARRFSSRLRLRLAVNLPSFAHQSLACPSHDSFHNTFDANAL